MASRMQLEVRVKFVQAIGQLSHSRFSNRTTWVTLAVLIAVALAVCGIMLRPWAGPLFGGAVLAVCSHPLHQRIRRRVGNRTISAALSVSIICLVLLIPLTLTAVAISKEIGRGYASLETTTLN